jgi:hypothetical protein
VLARGGLAARACAPTIRRRSRAGAHDDLEAGDSARIRARSFAFAYTALGVSIAAGVLSPAFGLLLGPVLAALVMSFGSASVMSNALPLRSARPGDG